MMGQRSITQAAILATLLFAVMSHPVPEVSQDNAQAQRDKAALVEKLETDLLKAAALGGIAEAVKLEQKFEEQILNVAVKTLTRDRGDPEKQARDMQALNELVRRDKRAVELLTGVLGGSSGGGDASSSGGLLSGLLGGSSGGGNANGDGADGGGGSNLLSLVSGLLGSSSGGGSDSDDGSGGGGSNLLSLIPSLLGSSSGGGGDGGGGSNALSLISGILGSSSGGGSGDASGGSTSGGGFRPLGNIFDQKLNLLNVGGGDDVLKGGTYDDLIGKSGGSNFIGTITNTVSAVLRAKFNIFKSLFSSLTGGLLGGGAAAA